MRGHNLIADFVASIELFICTLDFTIKLQQPIAHDLGVKKFQIRSSSGNAVWIRSILFYVR